jgi:hypothetical protein
LELDLVERDARAGSDAAARAESLRLGGDPEGALVLAREALAADPDSVSARATAALAFLDLGREADARRELESLVVPAPEPVATAALEAFDDAELEQAFEEAAPETEAMQDANEVAFEAMRAVERELADPAAAGSPFRTRTMAQLLERQGDRDGARAIRASLDAETPPRGGRRRTDMVRTLERWLERVRRGDA